MIHSFSHFLLRALSSNFQEKSQICAFTSSWSPFSWQNVSGFSQRTPSLVQACLAATLLEILGLKTPSSLSLSYPCRRSAHLAATPAWTLIRRCEGHLGDNLGTHYTQYQGDSHPYSQPSKVPEEKRGGEWLRRKGREVRSRNHSIFSSSAPGTSVKKWRINHCQFFLGGSFRPSQHVSPQDLMRNDLRITRRGNTTNRPSRRPFLTSVVMPICLRIGVLMGGWDNLFF